jgi:hypothetical protein
MTTTKEDTYDLHKNQLQTDKIYAMAWAQKETLLNEAWNAGRSKEDRRGDLIESASPAHKLDTTIENKRRDFIKNEAREFHTAYTENRQAVIDDFVKTAMERQQGQSLSQAPEKEPTSDKAKVSEQGLDKVAAAQKGQSHDYSALKPETQQPEHQTKRLTKEQIDGYRAEFKKVQEQKELALKSEKALESYGENRGKDHHHYGSLKTRKDEGMER